MWSNLLIRNSLTFRLGPTLFIFNIMMLHQRQEFLSTFFLFDHHFARFLLHLVPLLHLLLRHDLLLMPALLGANTSVQIGELMARVLAVICDAADFDGFIVFAYVVGGFERDGFETVEGVAAAVFVG